MTTALIADDEDLPRKDLRRMLAELWPDLHIVAEAEHGSEALEAIQNLQPDVAFLDIRMPGMTGLDVANACKGGRSHIVFTTAYDNHALEAFSTGALDYLLKPISQERLKEAIARLKARFTSATNSTSAPSDLSVLMQELDKRLRPASAERIRWISASVGDTIKMIPIDKVLYFTSDEKYTRVVAIDDEAHIRKPLKEIIDGLDPDLFWQIHRGTVVRADAIAKAHRDELGKISVQLRGTKELLKVSQAYAWRFKPM